MYSLLVYSECSSVSRGVAVSGSHQWTVPVQICSELFHFLYTCFIIVKVILVVLMISSIW